MTVGLSPVVRADWLAVVSWVAGGLYLAFVLYVVYRFVRLVFRTVAERRRVSS